MYSCYYYLQIYEILFQISKFDLVIIYMKI